jgi:nucleoside 2-deoxyribosyltransferase
MIRVYLAARYSRRVEINAYADLLRALGYDVTSRWLLGNHQLDDVGLSVEGEHQERIRFAQEDWEDLTKADLVISFTELPRSAPSRGGRHVEFGVALARGKWCVVVGPRENVFHCLPQVSVFTYWNEALPVIVRRLPPKVS